MGYDFVKVGEHHRTSLSTPFSATHAQGFENIELIYEKLEDNTYDFRISPNSFSHTLPILWTEPPPDNFEHLLVYAGRMWGYDRDRNSIRFSFIDGNGNSRFDWFPYEDVAIPHEITLEGMQESKVTALAQKPGRGGIYVFFRDRISTITGQALVSGLFSTELPPRTDLDASGGVPDMGTQSPLSVINFRSSVIFLGSDKHIWQLVDNKIVDIGSPIQYYLDRISDSQLSEVNAFHFNDRYHINIGSRTFVYDVAKKYWTSYNWNIQSAWWDRGGAAAESTLYALLGNQQLVKLYEGDDDSGAEISWTWESQSFSFDDIHTFSAIYVKTRTPFKQVRGHIIVNDVGVKDINFVPRPNNRFMSGFYGRGSEIKIILTGSGEPPIINGIEIEFA